MTYVSQVNEDRLLWLLFDDIKIHLLCDSSIKKELVLLPENLDFSLGVTTIYIYNMFITVHHAYLKECIFNRERYEL